MGVCGCPIPCDTMCCHCSRRETIKIQQSGSEYEDVHEEIRNPAQQHSGEARSKDTDNWAVNYTHDTHFTL